MKKSDKITLHCNIERSVLERFDKAYPHCRTRFVENAFLCALEDKIVFDKIFFKDLLSMNGSFPFSKPL